MTIESIFDGFKNLNVMVVGDVMVDAYIWGDVSRVSPEAPVPVVKTTGKEYRLGGAANVALNLSSLGAKPLLCCVLGADYEGDRFIQRLKMRGMSQEGIVRSKTRPTTIKTRVLSGSQQIVRIDAENESFLDTAEENALINKVFEHITEVDIIIFEDYDKGSLTSNVIAKVLGRAKELNIPTIVDPKNRNFLSFKNVSVFKPNLKELKEGLKLDNELDDIPKISNAVKELIEIIEAEEVLLTLSEMGVFVKNREVEIHVPAHVRTISDVSGAGDTVISIIALCKALGLSLAFTAELANLGGGLVCEHVGVVPVNKDRLIEEANKYNIISRI